MNSLASDPGGRPVQLPPAGAPADPEPFRRLLIRGNVLVLVLVAALVALSLYQSRLNHVRQAEALTTSLARQLARDMDGILERTSVVLGSVAVHTRNQTGGNSLDSAGLGPYLAGLRALVPEAASLRVADRQGVLRYGTGTESGGGVSIADRDHFVRGRDNKESGLIVNGPVVSRITEKQSLLLARRLELADGTFAGLVTAAIETEFLNGRLAIPDLDKLGSAALLNRDLRPIARHPATGDAVADGGDNQAGLLREALRKSQEEGSYTAVNGGDGAEWKTSYVRLAEFPLYVVTSVSLKKYLADWRDEALWTVALASLVVLAVLATSWGLYRHWLRQLRAGALLRKESFRNKVLVHTANEGIHVLDRRGRVAEANPAFCQLLGYTREELVGRNIAEIDRGVGEHHHIPGSREALVGRKLYETRLQARDGRLVDVEISATGVEVEGRHLTFAFVRDISVRKQAEAEQRRLHRTLELLMDSHTALLHAEQEETLLPHICRLIVEKGGYRMAWIGFAETDPDRTVRPVAASGYEDGYLEAITVSWGDDELGRGPTGTAIRTGKTAINQNVLTNVRMAPWREAAIRQGYHSSIGLPLVCDGVVVGALTIYGTEPHAFGTDEIPLLERLADNLAHGIDSLRGKSRLIAVNQELQAFTYASSHDLKTPLRAISSFSELLGLRYRDRLEGEGQVFLDQISQGAARMTALIDNLLAYARVEQGSRELEAVDLCKAMEGVLAERQDEMRQARLYINLPAVRVRANAQALALVLRNLLDNSCLYAGTNRPLEIEIGGEAAEGICRLWIRDNGIGFDMAYHDRIFEIFRRLHTYEEYPGSGLGLALVKRALELMGGRVWASSLPGQGTTFFVELMVESQPPAVALAIPESGRRLEETLLPH